MAEDTTLKQEKFCRLYTQNSELFGNGTLAYAEAYGYDLETLDRTNEKDEKGKEIPGSSEFSRVYNMCSSSASRMLRNEKINELITKSLNELMKDEVVDAQLAKVIMQDNKLEAKMSGIKEYNNLKQRIIKKTDITSNGLPIVQLVNSIAEKNGIIDSSAGTDS